jgi:hypothetical protein
MSFQGYSLYTASLIHAGGTLSVDQLDGQDYNPGVNLQRYIPPGSVDPANNSMLMADPRMSFRTRDLANVLDAISATAGLVCSGGAVFRFQQRNAEGTFKTGGSHITLTSAAGWAVLTGLSASQGQDAEATVQYLANGSGVIGEDPFVAVTNANFSGVDAPAHNTLFTLGPMKIGSTFIEGLQGMQVDFGLQIKRDFHNGEIYPRSSHTETRLPRITMNSLNPAVMSNITSALLGNIGSSIVLFLQKRTTGDGAIVAHATAEHVAVTIAAGSWRAESIGAAGTGDANVSVGIDPTGTITVSPASAIS